MLRVKIRSQFKILLLLLSVFFTIPTSYANKVDPCDEITGKWVGKWTNQDESSHSCEWDVSAIGAKHENIVRLETKFSKGKGSSRNVNCKNITKIYSGTCEQARILLGVYAGTIFGGVLELHGPLPQDGARLYKKK